VADLGKQSQCGQDSEQRVERTAIVQSASVSGVASPDPQVDSIRSVLVRLRTRAGLTVERLRSTEVDIESLLALPVVRHIAQTSGGADPLDALVQAIRQLATRLEPADLVVVDAALALGLLRDRIPKRADADRLYAADLGERRKQLVILWSTLLARSGIQEIPPSPTVRSLRATVEQQALGRLAELCVTTVYLAEGTPADASAQTRKSERPTVMIVGAAAMDRIQAVDHLPTAGTSVQASSLVEEPGGKGFNQAVACARLGLDVDFWSVIGGDSQGDAILAKLELEGISTRGVRRVRSGRTPTADVYVTPAGESITVAYTPVQLESNDVTSNAARAVIHNSDAIILTFEPSNPAVHEVLEAVRQVRPKLLIVRPSPPTNNPQLLYEHLSSIDYIVATPWELEHLLPEWAASEPTTEDLATQLLQFGVGGVCVINHLGCQFRSAEMKVDQEPFTAAVSDVPGARDAFVGAFVHRVLSTADPLTRDDLAFATAAMAAAVAAFGKISSSMPNLEQIDRILKVDYGVNIK
jgi:ribokinase